MRLDVFLRISRLIPRRTLAQEFCDKGLIAVNGTRAKASKEIKVGDAIEIRRRNSLITVKVSAVPETKQLSKANAGTTFEMVSTKTLGDTDR